MSQEKKKVEMKWDTWFILQSAWRLVGSLLDLGPSDKLLLKVTTTIGDRKESHIATTVSSKGSLLERRPNKAYILIALTDIFEGCLNFATRSKCNTSSAWYRQNTIWFQRKILADQRWMDESACYAIFHSSSWRCLNHQRILPVNEGTHSCPAEVDPSAWKETQASSLAGVENMVVQRKDYGFWGPGERTTGVESPSTLSDGMWTCELELLGNWKERKREKLRICLMIAQPMKKTVLKGHDLKRGCWNTSSSPFLIPDLHTSIPHTQTLAFPHKPFLKVKKSSHLEDLAVRLTGTPCEFGCWPDLIPSIFLLSTFLSLASCFFLK